MLPPSVEWLYNQKNFLTEGPTVIIKDVSCFSFTLLFLCFSVWQRVWASWLMECVAWMISHKVTSTMCGPGTTTLAGATRASPVDLWKSCLSLTAHETSPPWRWVCGLHQFVFSVFTPLTCAKSFPIHLSRSTATTCSRSTSRPSARWCVTSAQSQTGRPRRSPSAPWWTRRTPVPASSPSTWPITWPVPSSASSTLLMPGCCSVRSPSSQVQIKQLFVKALSGSFTLIYVYIFY